MRWLFQVTLSVLTVLYVTRLFYSTFSKICSREENFEQLTFWEKNREEGITCSRNIPRRYKWITKNRKQACSRQTEKVVSSLCLRRVIQSLDVFGEEVWHDEYERRRKLYASITDLRIYFLVSLIFFKKTQTFRIYQEENHKNSLNLIIEKYSYANRVFHFFILFFILFI